MICQRCGWCCYGIPAHLPKGDAKMGSELCPYLSWNGTQAVCTIYGEPNLEAWEKTPCGAYRPNYDNDPLADARPCKMGFWIHGQGGLLQFIQDRPDICRSIPLTLRTMNSVYPIMSGRPNRNLYVGRAPTLRSLGHIQIEALQIKDRLK